MERMFLNIAFVLISSKVLLSKSALGLNSDYLGCYEATQHVSQLQNHSEALTSTNTPQACQAVCKNLGYRYAGVQNGKDCHCGNTFAVNGQTFDKMCQDSCSGDATLFCGGQHTQAIYRSGLTTSFKWKKIKIGKNNPSNIRTFHVGINEVGVKQIWLLSKHGTYNSADVFVNKSGTWYNIEQNIDYKEVSVGRFGVFIITASDDSILRRSGVTSEVPEGTSWTYLGGALKMESGLDHVYVFVDRVDGSKVYCHDGTAWHHVNTYPSGLTSVSIGRKVLWMISGQDIVYRLMGLADALGTPGQFANDGKVLISASDEDMVISLDANGAVYYRESVNDIDPIGTHWVPIYPGRPFKHVVAEHFAIWGLDNNNKLWKGELEVSDPGYVGCFVDESDRDLSALYLADDSMTVEMCKQHCFLGNYTYAAVQNGKACRCDNTFGKYGETPGDCGAACPGNFIERCGSLLRNSIYQADLRIQTITPDQRVSLNEDLELTCEYRSVLHPVHVAWLKDGVVVQNKTEATSLGVSSAEVGTVTYQCSVNYQAMSVTKNVTLTIEDSVVPCGTHKSVDDPSRSSENCGLLSTIQRLDPTHWYQFYGSGGSQLPTQCVKENRCGAKAPGWLSGAHPAREEGVVTRTLCFNYQGDCCYYSINVNVRHCFGYYIYKFPKIPNYPARICTEKEPRGAGPSSLVVNPQFFMTSPKNKNMALDGFVLATFHAVESTGCNIFCLLKPQCKSYNYNHARKECELNTKMASKSLNLSPRKGFSYYHPAGSVMKVASRND